MYKPGCRANQWTSFYMITTSVIKELIFYMGQIYSPLETLLLKCFMIKAIQGLISI